MMSSFLGKTEEPFEIKRARVGVDYGPRTIGCNSFYVLYLFYVILRTFNKLFRFYPLQ